MKAFFLTIFLVIIFSVTGYACSCGEWDFDFTLQQSEEIFLGKIIRIELDKYLFLDDYSNQVYTFQISKKWLGSSSNQISIFDSDGCFPSLHHGGEYIIYAYKDESQFEELIRTKTELQGLFDTSTLPGYRYTTMYCMRIKEVLWHKEEAPFRDEIALLDSTFTEPVTLRPYYLNFTNLFLLILVILVGIFVGNKNQNKKPS